MSFIQDLNLKNTYSEEDYIIIEDAESTKRIKIEDLLRNVPIDIKLDANNNISLKLKDGTQLGDGATLPISNESASEQIQMVFDGVWVKWRKKSDSDWINLFSIADIGVSGGSGGSTTKDISIRVGTVTTLPAGSDATVVVEEPTDNEFVLSFGLPRGESVTVDNEGVAMGTQITTNVDKTSSKVSIIVRTNNRYIYGTLSSLSLLTNTAEKELHLLDGDTLYQILIVSAVNST